MMMLWRILFLLQIKRSQVMMMMMIELKQKKLDRKSSDDEEESWPEMWEFEDGIVTNMEVGTGYGGDTGSTGQPTRAHKTPARLLD
ncbi:hypothetical protein L6452_35705 [Arctium lappa]|uniref:Uncharacterized protein n=1 Tax=Arctium lappa TaxID=4217 RepID=A0ACB8Y814_ARCLA|nr:hypothetical protein L6452_35705 [Arctium lappa]